MEANDDPASSLAAARPDLPAADVPASGAPAADATKPAAAPATAERATVRVPPPPGRGPAAPRRKKPPTVRLFHPGSPPASARISSRARPPQKH